MGPAERFTRMEKVAIFLMALGDKRAREILDDLDLNSVEQLNAAIQKMGSVKSAEKASIMLEFARFFYYNEPVQGAEDAITPPKDVQFPYPNEPAKNKKHPRSCDKIPETTHEIVPNSDHLLNMSSKVESTSGIEEAVLQMMEKLRQRLDPDKINWGRAGYDFGDGFKGPTDKNR